LFEGGLGEGLWFDLAYTFEVVVIPIRGLHTVGPLGGVEFPESGFDCSAPLDRLDRLAFISEAGEGFVWQKRLFGTMFELKFL